MKCKPQRASYCCLMKFLVILFKMRREESIVRPEFRGPSLPNGWLVFLPYVPYPEFSASIRTRSYQKLGLSSAKLYYLTELAVLVGSLGAPAAVSSLEKIRLAGLKRIILLSYCGSLSSSLRIGQVFVPLAAISDEGTSSHYIKLKNKTIVPPGSLTEKLVDHLKKCSLPFKSGTIVSTDTPYRETPRWLKKMQKNGAETVDMEVSAVFAFGHFYKIEVAALFLVSDELFSGHWKNGVANQNLKLATEKYFSPFLEKPFIY